jgi:hypothetical protein
MTSRLIIVSIFAKLLLLYRKQNISPNRPCKALALKCDIEIEGRVLLKTFVPSHFKIP